MVEKILESIQSVVFAPYENKRCVENNILTLTEAGKASTCKEVRFSVAGEVLVYKFDQPVKDENNDKISDPLLVFSKGIARSKCDYLLFYARNSQKQGEKLYVISCNMKSGRTGNMEDQMASGKILANFILQTALRCQHSWNSSTKGYSAILYDDFLREKVEYKEIAIYSKLPKCVEKYPTKSIPPRKTINCLESKIHNLL